MLDVCKFIQITVLPRVLIKGLYFDGNLGSKQAKLEKMCAFQELEANFEN